MGGVLVLEGGVDGSGAGGADDLGGGAFTGGGGELADGGDLVEFLGGGTAGGDGEFCGGEARGGVAAGEGGEFRGGDGEVLLGGGAGVLAGLDHVFSTIAEELLSIWKVSSVLGVNSLFFG